MSKTILIFDTSLLCCLLRIPGKDTCGPLRDRWNHDRVQLLIESHRNSVFVLPLATIIETGNHISQATGDRFALAQHFSVYLRYAASGATPWAAFSEQTDLWKPEQLIRLCDDWPILASANISIGDATIKDVAEFYSKAGYRVEIATGDAGLKAYETTSVLSVPRRRQ